MPSRLAMKHGFRILQVKIGKHFVSIITLKHLLVHPLQACGQQQKEEHEQQQQQQHRYHVGLGLGSID